jgi:DNA-binding transcriptional LysR family regulator
VILLLLSSLTDALAGVSKANAYVGKIRVTVPADFPAGIVAAAIAEFHGEHPAVRFELLLTNDVLDLVSENIDIALRIGASNPQESLVRRAIDMDFGLYASAEYLRMNGEPVAIEAFGTLIGPSGPSCAAFCHAHATVTETASDIRPFPQNSGCNSYPISPELHFLSKLLKRIAPMRDFDLRSSMIHAQPLPEA